MIEVDEDKNDHCHSPFDDLPTEIYEEIFKYLDVKDLVNCSLVSSHWRKMANNNKLWCHFCKKNGWNDVNSLSRVKSNFINKSFQFKVPYFENDTKKCLNDNWSDNPKLINVDKGISNNCINDDMLDIVGNEKRDVNVINDNDNIYKNNNKIMEIDNEDDDKLMDLAVDNEYRICDWKIHYLQRKFLSYNWHRGRFVRHWFDEFIHKNMKIPATLTYAVDDLNESWSFLPVIKTSGNHTELSLISLEGKPCKFCQLENTDKKIEVVCVSTDIIAYVRGSELIVRHFINLDVTSEVKDLKIIPDNCPQALEILIKQQENRNYFIKMNSKYIIAGDKFIFIRIWCRKTLAELDCVICPEVVCVFSYTFLYSNSIFFSTQKNNGRQYKVYEYNIVSRSLKEIAQFHQPVAKLIANDDFLIIVLDEGVNENHIVIVRRGMDFKDLGSHRILVQDTSQNWGLLEPQVFLYNGLLFYLNGFSVKIVKPDTKYTNALVQSELSIGSSSVSSMQIVHENLLILKTRNEIELWNWENGCKLYTPCFNCDEASLFYDCTRLVLFHKSRREISIIGYW